jgi:hypothetical protein
MTSRFEPARAFVAREQELALSILLADDWGSATAPPTLSARSSQNPSRETTRRSSTASPTSSSKPAWRSNGQQSPSATSRQPDA